MLDTIKNAINLKNEFLESATIIFEDATLGDINNLIILEETEVDIDEIDADVKNDNDDDDIENNIETEEIINEDDDLLNASVDDENDTENIPTGVSKYDGEPPADDISDLLQVTVDLTSNTVKDVLPAPPENALDNIDEDDLLNASVDDNDDNVVDNVNDISDTENNVEELEIEEDNLNEEDNVNNVEINDEDDILEEGSGTPPAGLITGVESVIIDTISNSNTKNVYRNLVEAISLEGESDDGSDDVPADVGNEDTGSGDNNDISDAVRNKVNESEEEMNVDELGEDEKSTKEDIMKKLSSLTKNIEDAKTAVMKMM